jgi:hypothetical protein
MFTVMHVADHDLEVGTRLYQTKLPIYYPGDSGAPAWFEMSTDDPRTPHLLDHGTVIVMNDNGKTVAKYKLG